MDLDLTHDDGKLPGWTVVAGPNGSGKTTFLQASAMTHPFLLPVELDPLFEMRGLRQGASLAKIEISFESGLFEGVQARQRHDVAVVFTSEGAGTKPGYQESAGNGERGWFLAAYGPYRRLAGGSVDSQRLTDSPNRCAARLVSIFREDVTFAETVNWLGRLHTRRLENRKGVAALLEGVLGLLSDGLLPGGAKAVKVDSDGLWIREGENVRVIRNLSDGYQTIAGLVLDLVRKIHGYKDEFLLRQDDDNTWRIHNERVVLIDEMELHLHPSWQRRIGFWFKDHFPNMQFIVTTHNPFICQAADPGGLIRLSLPEEGQPARKIDGEAFHAIVNGSTDDAYLSELFGLSESRSERAEKLLNDVAELEARIIADEATPEEEKRYEVLKKQLPPSADVIKALRRLEK